MSSLLMLLFLFQNLKQKSKERSLQSALSTVLEILNNLGHTFHIEFAGAIFIFFFANI
jgi:hypothetical protein